MELTDVRRLTGPNLFLDGPGAAAEISVDGVERKRLRLAVETVLQKLLASIGWRKEAIGFRNYPGGMTIVVSAPIDALYAATSVIEIAWDMALEPFSVEAFAQAVVRIRAEIDEEADANLCAIETQAATRGIGFLWDDDEVSLGLGAGRQLWSRKDLPDVSEIDWDGVHDIPTALVTGTNGKSTTVRLASAIASAAGKVAASSSSDFVRVGDIILDTGDYSGPGGARMALRDPRAELAILETARGGLMRRGLPITNIDACLITNISADHLGEYGITDVSALADAKFMVAKAASPEGRLILNRDDPELVSRAKAFKGKITWFGRSMDAAFLAACKHDGDHAAYLDGEVMTLMRGNEVEPVLSVMDFPSSMGGAARYNIDNGLGAIALASALGLGVDAMRDGLSSFESTPETNPGRGNFMSLGGAKVLIDFAHNPEGVRALADTVKAVPAKRCLFLLGQGGDRSDADIREITAAVHEAAPDLYIVKDLPGVLRGRERGEVPAIILEKLNVLGVSRDKVMEAASEYEAVRLALAWAQPDDLLVLLVHAERERVLKLLSRLEKSDWQCGDELSNDDV
ncbi:MAG: Mur ligase family protein [Alphaproteobacteria bacterium]